ncbi:zinc ribbon domain-containing protein [Candidatus Peregrinibacteria bacterium]|nr:zinc ribbon domain-containing protein [Candidatus Peregrinibacteria bacterium]
MAAIFMPRYDFRCQTCTRTFETMIPFGSDELPKCPQCGERTVEKIISPPLGIHFHGSGFYKTDSRPVEKTPPPPEKSQASVTKTTKEKTPAQPASDTTIKPKTEKPTK